jgi:RNase P/RNase MRP subunit p30
MVRKPICAKIFPMRVLKIKDEKRVRKLSERLLRKGYVLAVVDREEDVKKALVKKADVVIIVK